jgi:hypothetical protein
MPFDPFENIETIDKERREAVNKSIRPISVEELKKLGQSIFDSSGEPWPDTFYRLIAEHPGGMFYQAEAGQGIILIYCQDEDKGLWYLPGSGMGILPPEAHQMLRDAIAKG